MIVYVLSRGESGEGLAPMSVHGSKARAVRAATRVVSPFGAWEETEPKGDEVRRWESSCDVMTIRRFTVDWSKG